MMLDDSLFNVASPEAVAAILHGQQTVSDAIDLLPMTADQLKQRGLGDDVIDHTRPDLVALLCQQILTRVTDLQELSGAALVAQREAKFQTFMDWWPVQ